MGKCNRVGLTAVRIVGSGFYFSGGKSNRVESTEKGNKMNEQKHDAEWTHIETEGRGEQLYIVGQSIGKAHCMKIKDGIICRFGEGHPG